MPSQALMSALPQIDVPMNSIIVDLRIAQDQYLRCYTGSAKFVSARSLDGRSVRFPANILRSFVSYDGIRGRFAIVFDSDGKFKKIKKLR